MDPRNLTLAEYRQLEKEFTDVDIYTSDIFKRIIPILDEWRINQHGLL